MRYFLAVLAIVAAATGLATAQTNRPISQAVQVCDPRYPDRCIKPGSGGDITASISGSLSVTAVVTQATVLQGTSPWIVSATVTNVTGTVSTGTNDGSDITQGARADTVCSTATGTCSVVALIKYLNNAVNSSIPAGTNAIGNVGIAPRTAQLTTAVISANSSGDNTLVTRATGTIKVYQMSMSCASSVTATMKNGGLAVSGPMPLTTMFLPFNGEPYYVTTTTSNFVMNLSSGVLCGGTIYYLDN